jgi:large subunit ribosomal protein L25
METQIGKLSVTRRASRGKGAARKMRAKGLVPAVVYGEKGESIALTISPADLKKALDPEREANTLLTLKIEGEGEATVEQDVVIKEYHLDPLNGELLHADFLRVSDDTVLDFKVPLRLTGRPPGVQAGGKLSQVFRELPIRCVPKKVPAEILGDVGHLEILQTLDVKDIKLDEGVEIALPPKRTLALVLQARGVEASEEAAVATSEEEGAA